MGYTVSYANVELKWENTGINQSIVENLIKPLKVKRELTNFAVNVLLGISEECKGNTNKFHGVLILKDSDIEFQKNVMDIIHNIGVSTNEYNTMKLVNKLKNCIYVYEAQPEKNTSEIIDSSLIKISWNCGDPEFKDYDLIIPDLQKKRSLTETMKSTFIEYYVNIDKYKGYTDNEIYNNVLRERLPVIKFNNFLDYLHKVIRAIEKQRDCSTDYRETWENLIFFINQQGIIMEDYLLYDTGNYTDGSYGGLGKDTDKEVLNLIQEFNSKFEDQQVIIEALSLTVKKLDSKLEELVNNKHDVVLKKIGEDSLVKDVMAKHRNLGVHVIMPSENLKETKDTVQIKKLSGIIPTNEIAATSTESSDLDISAMMKNILGEETINPNIYENNTVEEPEKMEEVEEDNSEDLQRLMKSFKI